MSSTLITDKRIYIVNERILDNIPTQYELDEKVISSLNEEKAYSSYIFAKPDNVQKHFEDDMLAPYNKFGMIVPNPKVDLSFLGSNIDFETHGIITILGGSGSGKSTMMRYLASERNYKLIKFGEPDADSLTGSPLHLLALLDYAMRERDVFILDSFKSLLIKSSTNLGKGGVSKDILEILSDINSQLLANKKSLIISINPQNPDSERDWFELLKGVSSVVIWADVPGKGIFSCREYEHRQDINFSNSLNEVSLSSIKYQPESIKTNIKTVAPSLDINVIRGR